MSHDDLVPDSALAARIATLSTILGRVKRIAETRAQFRDLDWELMFGAIDAFWQAFSDMAQPDDEINAKYRSRMREEYIATVDGMPFYPFDPKPDEVTHEAIITGLLHECRYNGQVPRFLSVLEHSIKVAAVCEYLAGEAVKAGEFREDLVPVVTFHGLLHDGHEAYTGDMPRPMKRLMMTVLAQPWDEVEAGVQAAILEAYNAPPLFPEGEAIIKLADNYVLHMESLVLKATDLREHQYGQVPPAAVQDVARVRATEPNRKLIRDLFDQEARRLVAVIGGRIPGEQTPTEKTRAEEHSAPAPALAEVAHVPGDRPREPLPKAKPEFIPNLSREPRPSDVGAGEWQNALRSTEVQIPPELMSEPEFKGD